MKEPLGAPRGSVRAVAFLLLIGGTVGGFFFGLVSAEQFMQLVTMAATFYFVTRPSTKLP